MLNISIMILPVLLLFSAVPRSLSNPTYERHDPLTGERLLCDMCPPGTHMSEHCTATTPTKCKPCREDHFTELWNYLPRCLFCSTFCMDNMEVEKECSALNDRVCRCKQSYYMDHDFCVRHTECGPGHGVQIKGTPHKNTVCERCPEGTHSNSSSALEPCVNHQTCASGQTALLSGSIYYNTVCGTCEDLANGGETLRAFLTAFLNTHRMPLPKMKRFVTRYILRSGEERRPRHRGPLMDHIKTWLAEAPQEDLLQLPLRLKSLQLTCLTDKLEKRLREIEQLSSNCSLPL